MKKNTFYERKDYSQLDLYKYVRIDDIIGTRIYYIQFTENMVEGVKGWGYFYEDSWTELPKSLSLLCVGDLVFNGTYYRKVLGVINQNCYILSCNGMSTEDSLLEECGSTMVSVQDLELEEFKPYPTEPTDDTIEIEGKKYSVAEIKEKLK